MNTKTAWTAKTSSAIARTARAFALSATLLIAGGAANAQVAQQPLFLGGGDVPGNLVLVPSVEWPTITSVSSINEYSRTETFLGYFDPDKCYLYSYSSTEANRHFYPNRFSPTRECDGSNEWAGNFLNWAATQTIDPFRSVLTGGLRVVDTPTETWLEKARHTGQGGTGIYPDRRLPASGNDINLVRDSMPFGEQWVRMRIQGLGNKMRFRIEDDDTGEALESYQPGDNDDDNAYEVSIRVKVCVPGLLETNCRAYSSGFKPEGVIQENADQLRYSIFGYLNDPNYWRDGGVLRAQQKFVGPKMIVPGTGEAVNPNKEWDEVTGVLIRNPNPSDASATAAAHSITIQDSGVINYLNKFGQMTSNNHKSYDPVSELYYTALRYLKNQGNVATYSAIPGNTGIGAVQAADGFPVITNWDDPIQYACQKNVLLGIGDIYTHRDKNLPGTTNGNQEPGPPPIDTSVNVSTQLGQVAGMEGFTINTPFTGRENSAYMVGLAWDAHTRDLRPTDPNMPGIQTASTHWVDVLEGLSLEDEDENQYYLTAKYGGFEKPDDFDPDTHTGALPQAWWNTTGQTITTFGPRASPAGHVMPRPDNYYVAGSSVQMVQSLQTAFANIAAEVRSSASAVAANSTRLGADTAVYQAAFDSANWSGELKAFRINTDGTINTTPVWSAASRLDAKSELSLNSRKIFTVAPPTSGGGGSMIADTGVDFTWTDLTVAQRDSLRQVLGAGPLVSNSEGQDRLAFLRGSRLLEQPSGLMRQRDSRLGDISNSDPQLMGHQDFGYGLLDQSVAFNGLGIGADYLTFRSSAAYIARPPVLIVGANDGMLHGFDANLSGTGGDELFAFIPNSVFDNLYELTLPAYSHRFYVDGAPRVADAYFSSAWHSVAVGATGAGGKSVFALDVTNPTTMSTSNVMWEFSHPDLGYTIGQPAITPLPNGKFGVVISSGYETGSADGSIWVLDIADGSIIHKFTLPNSGDVGAPLVVDLDGDRVADRIYAGDSDGNLWRLDMTGALPSAWGAPASLTSSGDAIPLFIALDGNGVRQAITAPLASAFNDNGLHTIFFGTGSFYRLNDNVVPPNPDVDSFYAVIDRGAQINGRSNLMEQSILAEVSAGSFKVRAVTANMLTTLQDGWFMDMEWPTAFGGPGPAGERVVSRAIVRGDRVIFATVIPNPDPCSFGGDSWIMELNAFNGGRLDYAVFDLDEDGEFNSDDWVTVTDENGATVTVPASGIAPDIGIVKTPAVITGVGDNDDEVKVLSGSSGQLIRISERGAIEVGRQSWRQLR